MAPPLTKAQEEQLFDLYYNQKYHWGRDKLWKIALDKGIKISRRQVMDWLRNQELNQLYRQKKPIKNFQPTLLSKSYQQIGLDIVDMQQYEVRGHKYMLNAVDLFSRFAYSRALKTKSAKEVADAFKSILDEIKEPVSSIRTDNGSEFISAEWKKITADRNIKHIFSLPALPQSNGAIERLNGVLKRQIKKNVSQNDTYDWVEDLPNIIKRYNTTFHRIINTTPEKANSSAEPSKIRETMKKNMKTFKDTVDFQVGDNVRIRKDGNDGENWSREVYTIAKVNKPRTDLTLASYRIKKRNGELVKEKFFNYDLLKISKIVENKRKNPAEKFEVAKLVRPSIQNKVKGYIVRWKNYTAKDDTFQSRQQLLREIPKMVRTFERENNVEWLAKRFRWNNPT